MSLDTAAIAAWYAFLVYVACAAGRAYTKDQTVHAGHFIVTAMAIVGLTYGSTIETPEHTREAMNTFALPLILGAWAGFTWTLCRPRAQRRHPAPRG